MAKTEVKISSLLRNFKGTNILIPSKKSAKYESILNVNKGAGGKKMLKMAKKGVFSKGKSQKRTHCLEWGNGHKLFRKDLLYLKLLAWEKAFYFSEVKIDGEKVRRSL